VNPIDDLFARLRKERRKAFIPFITAGDPDLATTAKAILELDAAGCHLVEVGFPFSDPIADGPVIQASYTRALDRGLKLDEVFACVEGVTVAAPLVGMVSYTLIHRRGAAAFVERAKKAGFSGLIVPDMPAEEAEDFAKIASERDMKSIMLVAPTTPPERVAKIAMLSSGFLYCISVAGITGERDRLPDEILGQLRRIRTMTDLPLCVGFGVSRPEHVRMLRDEVDGVIVGSAIVRRIENIKDDWSPVRDLVRSLIDALNPPNR
jgi:tryptophan synthase alpha chain